MLSLQSLQYLRKQRDQKRFAYQLAREVSKKAGSKHKLNYDFKAISSILKVGDQVLFKNAGVRGSCKLTDQWHKDPYIVIDQPNDGIPVY